MPRLLQGEQRPVTHGGTHQLAVRSLLDDPPALQHRDAVGERDRRGTVRDHQSGPTRHHRRQSRTDLVLLRRVDRRRRVVQHQHRRIREDRPRDRHTLALPARQGEPALPEHRVVSVGKVRDEPCSSGERRRPLDVLVIRVGPREADVLAHAVREEKRLLEHERDGAADVGDLQLAHVVPVQQHRPSVRVVQTRQQSRDGALPRAGRADERERLSGSEVQVEPVEHRPLSLMSELHAGKPNVSAQRPLELRRMTRFAQLRLGVQHLADPRARPDRLLQRRHTLSEDPQRPDEHRDVRVERDERAEREVAGDHAPPAEPQHREQAEHRQELERRQEHRVEARDVERPVDDRAAAHAELGSERLPGAEPLDDPDPTDRLLDERRRLAPAFLQPLRALVVAPRVPPGCQRDQRQRDQDDERQLPVEDEQHDRDRENGEDVADRVPDRVHHPRDVLRVGRGA